MAQNEVLRKLSERLTRLPITEEETTVYVLTQVRKMLEFDYSQREEEVKRLGKPLGRLRYPTLGFYCNWALHTFLDRAPAQEFMNKVMPLLILKGDHTEAESREFGSLLTLQSFRDELGQYLLTNQIPDALCADENNWVSFVDAYSRVVNNTKLIFKGNHPPTGPLNLTVETITVEAATGSGFAPNRPFPMNWLIAYADGRNARLELSHEGLLGATFNIL